MTDKEEQLQPGGQRPSLADFDFSSFETPEKHDRFSDDAIDSDVEDAIYARVYFDARDESHQSWIEGNVLESSGPGLSGDSEEGVADEVADRVRWSISFALSSSAAPGSKSSSDEGCYTPAEESSKGKGKAASAVKLKRKRGSVKNSAEGTRPSDTADTGEFVVMDTYTIDLTGGSVGVPSEALAEGEKSVSTSKSQRRQRAKERKRKQDAGKANAMEGRDNPLKELDTSAAEADIRRLFSEQEESAVIVLSSDGESSGDRGCVVTGSGSGSSIESGELVGSGDRSRVSSDMDICSDNSVDVAKMEDTWKINDKDRLGAEAYERLHGIGDSVGRYYGELNAKCINCKQRGHSAKTCPWPKRHTVCYLCAEHGHISSSCPKSLCTYCYRAKHRGMTCRVPWGRGTVCSRCFMMGHHASLCPDHWRQFHHTTYDSYNVVTSDLRHQRRVDKMYCSNCSSPDHFGFECTRTIPRGNPAYHTPLVTFYDQRAWPPRDPHSREVIRQALASRAQASTSSSPPSGRKRAQGEQCEDEQGTGRSEISPPSKKNREASPQSSGKKKRRRNKRKGEDFDARELIDERESLLITVDGRGSNTIGGGHHGSLQDSSPLVNHVHLRARPSLLGTPPSGPMPARDFPRVPHPSPYHSPPPGYTPHFPMDQGGGYNAPPGGQGAWHYNDPGHTFTPPTGGGREVIHRSLSAGDHHLPSQHYRRHSEHLDRRSQQDSMPPLTPTYPRPGNANRGRLVSHRGFQMSVEAAHRTGLYGGSPAAGSGGYDGGRRYSQERKR